MEPKKIPILQALLTSKGIELDSELFDEALYEELMRSVTGIEKNSLVTRPAIGLKAVLQSASMQQVKVNQHTEEDKRLITGIKLIPDMLLLKYDGDQPYFDTYSKEVIYHARNKFMMKGNIHAIDWEHSGPNLQDIYLVESWIVGDGQDKIYSLGYSPEEVPAGSWAVSYYVPNDELWKELKSNPEGYGFSIKGWFGFAPSEVQASTKNDKVLLSAIALSKDTSLSDEEKLIKLIELIKN